MCSLVQVCADGVAAVLSCCLMPSCRASKQIEQLEDRLRTAEVAAAAAAAAGASGPSNAAASAAAEEKVVQLQQQLAASRTQVRCLEPCGVLTMHTLTTVTHAALGAEAVWALHGVDGGL